MPHPAVIGLDIAKNVFRVHGADAEGRCVLRRRLRRAEIVSFFARLPKALIGIGACPSGPHYMRFVPIKLVAQQAAMMLHRTRALPLRQRTQLINAVRGHLAEFGLVARRGARNIRELAELVRDTGSDKLPDAARAMLVLRLEQIREAQLRVRKTEHALEVWAKQSDACRRVMSIPGLGMISAPGLGMISATALVLAMDDPKRFRSGRHFAAWLGLVPRQGSSGDRQVLGGIGKRGDGYVRTLLIHGARSLTRWRRESWTWLAGLLMRRPTNVAAVAIANKTARTAWAIPARGHQFQPTRRAEAASAEPPRGECEGRTGIEGGSALTELRLTRWAHRTRSPNQ